MPYQHNTEAVLSILEQDVGIPVYIINKSRGYVEKK